MTITKTEVVSVRVPPDVKAALAAAAHAERRSCASMLEVMVLAYCKSRGIASPAYPPKAPPATPRNPKPKPQAT